MAPVWCSPVQKLLIQIRTQAEVKIYLAKLTSKSYKSVEGKTWNRDEVKNAAKTRKVPNQRCGQRCQPEHEVWAAEENVVDLTETARTRRAEAEARTGEHDELYWLEWAAAQLHMIRHEVNTRFEAKARWIQIRQWPTEFWSLTRAFPNSCDWNVGIFGNLHEYKFFHPFIE